ncbi:MAG: formate dehydrogenase family accessory protein FdhD [Nitrospirae bacterium CG_4_9_14_3_um_filter_53_35]|nr:MAG: formate dehydrogenase family accessory protein FdhD [Nitrospirae bacterium CG_4_8_14_3_um_filter_50_41]PJA72764.1 MAG: formate dehydrogenase family accessory protein FdhD [Nitrospirae bacterium CG_4_9_14_3_um_filter_53_35]
MQDQTSALYTERKIMRYEKGSWNEMNDRITLERPLHLEINGKEFITLLCTPVQRKELAAGFLLSEGIIQSPEQILSMDLKEQEDLISMELTGMEIDLEDRVKKITLTSGCGRGTILCDVMDAISEPRISGSMDLSPVEIMERMHELHHHSSTYLKTGGTHSAAVTDGRSLLAFAEDLGRHNAVDKVLGFCFLNRIPTGDKAVLASGRISSEIIMKVGRSGVPILVTRAAATDQVIRIAEAMNITLIGFARGTRMNVYTCPERITGTGRNKS